VQLVGITQTVRKQIELICRLIDRQVSGPGDVRRSQELETAVCKRPAPRAGKSPSNRMTSAIDRRCADAGSIQFSGVHPILENSRDSLATRYFYNPYVHQLHSKQPMMRCR